MSHYAKIINSGNQSIVEQIIVAEQDFIETLPGTWIQTSYNTRGGIHYGQDNKTEEGNVLKKNFAAIVGFYDKELDAFYSNNPFESWILNKETWLWEAPFLKPNDGKEYQWNEESVGWVVIEKR